MKEALDSWLAAEAVRLEGTEGSDADPLWVVVERFEKSARLSYTSPAQQRHIIIAQTGIGEFHWQMGWTHLCYREVKQAEIIASTASGEAQSIAGCFNDAEKALWEYEAWGSFLAPSGQVLTEQARAQMGVASEGNPIPAQKTPPLDGGWSPLAKHPELAEYYPMTDAIAKREDIFIIAVFRCFDGNFGWGFGRGKTAEQLCGNFSELAGYGLQPEEAKKQAEKYLAERLAKLANSRAKAARKAEKDGKILGKDNSK